MKQSEKLADKTAVVGLQRLPTGGASDMALRTDVSELMIALERVLALRPVTWHWKTDSKKQALQYGFIAQEVEKVFPDLATTKEWIDGSHRKFLSTKALIPYLVKAFKEQQQQIDALHHRLDMAEAKNKDM